MLTAGAGREPVRDRYTHWLHSGTCLLYHDVRTGERTGESTTSITLWESESFAFSVGVP